MTLRAVSGLMLLGVACVVLMSGCSRERIDWKSAESADTPEGYNHFLERHPDGELAAAAKARLAQLLEEKDWQHASSADTAASYKQFLTQHPDGKFSEEARIRVENFALDTSTSPTGDASASTAASTSTAAPGTPAEPPTASSSPVPTPPPARTPGPPSKPAPVAPTSATPPPSEVKKASPSSTPSVASASHAPSGGSAAPKSESSSFGIQLGAFSSQAAALTEWKRLQVKFDPQLHGLFAHAVPAQVTSGTLFRLQSPVGEESRARNICAALTQQQQPCVVVLPDNH